MGKLPKALQIGNFKRMFKAYNPERKGDIDKIDWQSHVSGETMNASLELLENAYPGYNWTKEQFKKNTGGRITSKEVKDIENKIKEQQKFESEKEEEIEDLKVEKEELKEKLEKLKQEKLPVEQQGKLDKLEDRLDEIESKVEGVEVGGTDRKELEYLGDKIEKAFDKLDKGFRKIWKEMEEKEEKKGKTEKEEARKRRAAKEMFGAGGRKKFAKKKLTDDELDRIRGVGKKIPYDTEKFVELFKKLKGAEYIKTILPSTVLGVYKGLLILDNRKYSNKVLIEKLGEPLFGIHNYNKNKRSINKASKKVRRAKEVVMDVGLIFEE